MTWELSLRQVHSTIATWTKVQWARASHPMLGWHWWQLAVSRQVYSFYLEILTLHTPVYYRIYTEDDALPIKNAIFPDDPYLGHTVSSRIPPPHIAKNIARYILKREDIGDAFDTSRSQIFADVADETPLDSMGRMAILTGIGPGSKPNLPIAVVLPRKENDDAALSPIAAPMQSQFPIYTPAIGTSELPNIVSINQCECMHLMVQQL